MTRGKPNSMVTVMAQVHIAGAGRCWEWQGRTDKDGYGETTIGAKRTRVPRYVYEQVYGPLAPGEQVRHTCDNRLCVNPSHLIPGTTQENTADRQARGRHVRGARINTATMDEATARAILASGLTPAQAARAYGVEYKVAWRLIRRETWRHL